jgi:hypothetical protein
MEGLKRKRDPDEPTEDYKASKRSCLPRDFERLLRTLPWANKRPVGDVIKACMSIEALALLWGLEPEAVAPVMPLEPNKVLRRLLAAALEASACGNGQGIGLALQFHGTRAHNIEGILSDGFSLTDPPCHKQVFGPGIYTTSSKRIAASLYGQHASDKYEGSHMVLVAVVHPIGDADGKVVSMPSSRLHQMMVTRRPHLAIPVAGVRYHPLLHPFPPSRTDLDAMVFFNRLCDSPPPPERRLELAKRPDGKMVLVEVVTIGDGNSSFTFVAEVLAARDAAKAFSELDPSDRAGLLAELRQYAPCHPRTWPARHILQSVKRIRDMKAGDGLLPFDYQTGHPRD